MPIVSAESMVPNAPEDPFALINKVQVMRSNQALAEERQRKVQTEAEIQAIAQRHGDDHDATVAEISRKYPALGYKIGQDLEQQRYNKAQALLENSKAEREQIQGDLSLLQGADLTTGQSVLQDIITRNPKLTPIIAGRPYTNDFRDQLVKVGQTQDAYLDNIQKASEAYLDKDKQTAAARLVIAAGVNPPKQAAVAQMMKGAGLQQFATVFPDVASAQAFIDAQAKAAAEEKPQAPETEAIKQWTAEHGRVPTYAERLQIRKQFGQADDRPRVSVSVAGAPGTVGGLTTGEGGGLEMAGTMTRLLGRIPIGMSRGGSPPAIMNEAARQAKMLGQTPVVAMQKAAMYKSDQKALDQITKQAEAAYAYENKAEAQLDIVDGLSDKVWRTKSPLINRAIIAGQTEIAGDKDATLLLNAIMTASTEYAKIMMGGTASAAAITDSAQKEAQKLLSAGMSKGTLKGATALMRTEMGLTNKGYDAAKQHIMESMGGGQPPQTTAPPAASGGVKRQNWVFDKNGKLVPQ